MVHTIIAPLLFHTTRPPNYLVHSSFDLVAFVRKRINYVSCSSKEKEILLASLFIFIYKHNHAQLNKPASRTLLVKRKRYYEIWTYIFCGKGFSDLTQKTKFFSFRERRNFQNNFFGQEWGNRPLAIFVDGNIPDDFFFVKATVNIAYAADNSNVHFVL